jgi:predicted metal-dependent hydrolase
VSKKSAKIQQLIDSHRGKSLDAHYLGYFDCFNRGLYYEAHDVLEELWLPIRREPDGDFYKGLIQLAGAFVHLQKNRLRPAGALFKLAQANLQKFPATHEQLCTEDVLRLIGIWLGKLESDGFVMNPLSPVTTPKLDLMT